MYTRCFTWNSTILFINGFLWWLMAASAFNGFFLCRHSTCPQRMCMDKMSFEWFRLYELSTENNVLKSRESVNQWNFNLDFFDVTLRIIVICYLFFFHYKNLVLYSLILRVTWIYQTDLSSCSLWVCSSLYYISVF